MQLKTYQKATLATLDAFFARALATGPAEAFQHERGGAGEARAARRPETGAAGIQAARGAA